MKQLLLIRHGKSDWDHPGLADHDRPLNERGCADVSTIATALLERGVKPDLIISSSALRAATTARLIAGAIQFPTEEILFLSALYLASPEVLLRTVQQLDESSETVLIFGHNPGMHEAVNAFSSERQVNDFPTFATARFTFRAAHWGLIEWGSGELLELLTPRDLMEE